MEAVIKLPTTEDKPAAKRSRAAAAEPGEEEGKRRKNVRLVSVLGEEDGSVKMLEELVFGAEDELLGRLVSSHHTGCCTGTDQSNRAGHKGSGSSPGRRTVFGFQLYNFIYKLGKNKEIIHRAKNTTTNE